jgi:hypothetical protein
MSILDNIKKIQSDFKAAQDAGQEFPLAIEIQNKSIDAIIEGAESDDWSDYMEIFATNPAELARLIPTDGTDGDAIKRRARAYLVGNGPCGPETLLRLDFGVGDDLDYQL